MVRSIKDAMNPNERESLPGLLARETIKTRCGIRSSN